MSRQQCGRGHDPNLPSTGCSSARRECLPRMQEAVGSNPTTLTITRMSRKSGNRFSDKDMRTSERP
jgi:hypothetical protein